VLCARTSANLDEQVFARAAELDFARDPNPHLAFGYGPHYCLGAQLARMELQVALDAILARLPGLQIAVPEDQLTWHTGTMMRGLAAFPITWLTPATAALHPVGTGTRKWSGRIHGEGARRRHDSRRAGIQEPTPAMRLDHDDQDAGWPAPRR
jgi:hypothetical protein